jgi:hypothetical protein
MGEKIVLDGSTREVARAVAKDSVVTCTKTSAPDVYVNAITSAETTSLHAGDSAAIAKMLTLRLHIFRTSEVTPFGASAELDLSVVT